MLKGTGIKWGIIIISLLALILTIFGCTQSASTPPPTSQTTVPSTVSKSPTSTTKPLPSSATPGPVIKLKAQGFGGKNYPGQTALENIIKRLESTGRFKFDYFPNEGLMLIKEAFDGLRNGVLDIAVTSAGYQPDRMGIVATTFWMAGNWDYNKFYANYRKPGSYYEWAQPYHEKWGLRLLGQVTVPGSAFVFNKPVKTVEDVKGFIFRSTSDWADWIKLLGMSPVPFNTAEMFEGFQRGALNGTANTLTHHYSSKLYEAAPYIFANNWFSGGQSLLMNLALYNSWPADVKKLVEDAVLAEEKEYPVYAAKQYIEALENLKKVAKVYLPTDTELATWLKAIEPYFIQKAKQYGDEWTRWEKVWQTIK